MQTIKSKKVLVLGAGGREHALAWKLAQSPSVASVFVAPGNGGTALVATNVDIAFNDAAALRDFALREQIDLCVVGQEAASEAGVVDELIAAGINVFGPTKQAVAIESSKAFAKQIMVEKQIPTAAFQVFDNPDEALAYLQKQVVPIVVKASGLAEGKGVVVAQDVSEASDAIKHIMIDKKFGESGAQVVIEEFLGGQEVSIHALTDGNNAVLFPPSQDHKQVFDGDSGPNTGGMGVVAPVAILAENQLDRIKETVVDPALAALREADRTFVGCLYPGLMIDGQNTNVLEFNARFGDPEAETYMRLIDCDLYEVLMACVNGELSADLIHWHGGVAISVALASSGYPGTYEKGLPIAGLDEAASVDGVEIFHAGTKQVDGQLVTNGGRVLFVTALGTDLDDARAKAYEAVAKIHFDGIHYRSDIGIRKVS